MRFVGLILLIVFLVVGGGSSAKYLIDPPSAIIVIVGMIAGLLFAGASLPAMFRVFASDTADAELLRDGIRAWKLAAAYALAMGAAGTLIGLVIMLANMDDPAAIGPGMAIANLTTIYALLVALGLCLPVYRSLEARASTGPA